MGLLTSVYTISAEKRWVVWQWIGRGISAEGPTGARALELCGQELMSSYIGNVGTPVGVNWSGRVGPVAAFYAAVAGSNPTAGVGRKRNGGFGAEIAGSCRSFGIPRLNYSAASAH